ncbi:hypothetical protein LN461_04930 [Xanthomonas arboricola]|uniref:Uncharacterized protein n=1 Tax=Xanthomonas hydrangeae TaxID=2775159 RepID=A0AAU0BGE2_9XANT|nr:MULTISPECIES: hypothetical protein [Xanthomonas]MCC8668709.1 hypothetical protein [Xanthomonas arboricola]WOB51244.1 hypothetical protein NYR97_07690 [Xanthomonas hydrangeae]
MTKEEAYSIIRRVAEAFASGDCSNLPTMGEIEQAGAIIAAIAQQKKPEMERDGAGLKTLSEKLVAYLKSLANAAVQTEKLAEDAAISREAILCEIPDLDEKLPKARRKM